MVSLGKPIAFSHVFVPNETNIQRPLGLGFWLGTAPWKAPKLLAGASPMLG